jgi:hypothetical protein
VMRVMPHGLITKVGPAISMGACTVCPQVHRNTLPSRFAMCVSFPSTPRPNQSTPPTPTTSIVCGNATSESH